MNYPSCIDCPAPVKFANRIRCHRCHLRVQVAAAKRDCPRCGELRHLSSQPAGEPALCASCRRADRPRRPAKTTACRTCGQQRRNVGHGLCNRCTLADPDRPFRYGTSMANRMDPAPQWWPELVAFLAARRHVSGAVALLRTTGRLLVDAPRLTPAQLLTRTSRVDANTARVLATFFVHHGLALPGDEQHHRALDRQARLLGGVPPELADAVRCFHQTVRQQQDSARRGGRRPLTDTTLEGRLTILRDLARWLVAQRIVTGWAQIATVDLERFLAEAPQARHQRTYVLRGFFRWTKKHNITLVDPAKPLTLGRQPAFSSPLLDLARQRALFRRWTEPGTHPHERLTGLLALLHAASNQQIRGLRVNDVDPARRRITLAGRTFATPLDPATWDALSATLQHREQGKTLNPHVIVTGATGTGDRAASSSYLSRLLAQAGTTPSCARQSRISQLVTDLDPKLVAAALGMRDSGLVRYLADNVDQDRLDRHIRS